jgi:hypothetical protein
VPGVALASVASGTNEPVYHGPSSSYAEASWSASTDNISSLEAHPGGAFVTSPTPYCLAGIFDWSTATTGTPSTAPSSEWPTGRENR